MAFSWCLGAYVLVHRQLKGKSERKPSLVLELHASNSNDGKFFRKELGTPSGVFIEF